MAKGQTASKATKRTTGRAAQPAPEQSGKLPAAGDAIPQSQIDEAQLSPMARKMLENARSGAAVSPHVGKVYDYIKPDELIEESKVMPFMVTNAYLRDSMLEEGVQEVLYEIMMLDGAEYALTLTAIKGRHENRRRTSWVKLFPGNPVGPLRLVKTPIETGRWEGNAYVTFADARTGEVIGGRNASEDHDEQQD